MWKYILKRLGYMVIVFMIITFFIYCLFGLIPSDPAATVVEPLRDQVDAKTFEELYRAERARQGLDDPLVIRYLRWLGLYPDVGGFRFYGVLQGNLGESTINKRPVIDVIRQPMKNTITLNLMSVFLTLLITIPLGIKTAVKKGSLFDQSFQVITIVGHSLPVYIIGLALIYLFAVKLRILPVSGMSSTNATFTGFRAILDRAWHYILPLIVIVAANLGGMTRYVRAAMIDVLSMDYIRTARAKGLKDKIVIYSHAWRNALLPVITQIITWFMRLFSGSVIIENTFGLSGMGATNVLALTYLDYELAITINLFFTIVSLLSILVCDIAYGIVDPRVRVNR
jgi:peptide/nickel transport system permease protein